MIRKDNGKTRRNLRRTIKPIVIMHSFIRILTTSCLLTLGSVAIISSGCAGTSTRQSTGEYVDDTTITTKIKAEFVRDEVVKARAVSVETFKGIVQLSGFVDTATEKQRAETIAAGVQGVRDVKNNIVVKKQ